MSKKAKLYRYENGSSILIQNYLVRNIHDRNFPNDINIIIHDFVGYTPKTNFELKKAVNDWCLNKEKAILKYGHISKWNTQNITNMRYLFYYKKNMNENISNWIVKNVIDMTGMFQNAEIFNKPLSKWDVSNVKEMNCMFSSAKSFCQNIKSQYIFDKNGDIKYKAWDVSKVRNMNNMFNNAKKFNENLNNWEVNENTQINGMFENTQIIKCHRYKIPNWYKI